MRSLDASIGAPNASNLLCPEVLRQLLLGEGRWLARVADTAFDQSLADCSGEVIPRVFTVLAEVVAVMAMARCGWVGEDGIIQLYVEICLCVGA